MEPIINNFEDFKKASPEMRDYVIYNALKKLDSTDSVYAKKWVESAVKWVGTIMGGAVLYQIITSVLIGG